MLFSFLPKESKRPGRETATHLYLVPRSESVDLYLHSQDKPSCRAQTYLYLYQRADKSLRRPGRKQATATKQLLQATQKNPEGCPSNQVSVAGMTYASDEKWQPFNCFFSRVGLRTYQHPCTSQRQATHRKTRLQNSLRVKLTAYSSQV
jgi:hypothetical protein